MSETLSARGLRKRYGRREVVRGIDLEVGAGEIVGLLGPNGAGKTTSFYMLTGFVRCDEGQVRLGTRDITSLAVHERARAGLGYLAQEASVFRRLSVSDNIRAVLQLRRDLDRAGIERELEALLGELQLQHITGNRGDSLSGGERRRVEIARALAVAPRFMLLDEPFAGVDPIAVSEVQRIVTGLRERGIGVLITDHNVRETLGICERAYIVSAGTVIAQGTAAEVLDNPDVRQSYLGDSFRM